MINVRIDKGIQHFDVEGTPDTVVAEFGFMINQYCSAIKKMLPAGPAGLARGICGSYCAGKPGMGPG